MSTLIINERPVDELLAERDERIQAALAEIEAIEVAKGKNDKAAVQSAGGRLANRVREISELEYQLAEQGQEVEPWERPKTTKSRKVYISQQQLEASLAKSFGVWSSTKFDSVKTSADLRIQALLKAAAGRGYEVKDPRKAK